nr:hypothetical protein [Psychrobacter sp. PraFG1]UNK06442.1 hypothetical protein MN210_08085 [Psychrobacter sp. PraFG1]
MFDSIEDDYEINIEILEVIEQGNSSKQVEDNFVGTTDKTAKEQSITSELDPKEVPKSDVETFSLKTLMHFMPIMTRTLWRMLSAGKLEKC